MNEIYINKPKYINRASSNLTIAKKSVSIVSLSPNEHMHYGQNMIMPNPYTKGSIKSRIHLPYLKKTKRVMNRLRPDINNSNPRISSNLTNNNQSVDVLSSNSHK
jgi:hypothetical protein